MPLTDKAYWPGDDDHPPENRSRCTAKPTKADIAADRGMRRDTWECSLWKGHQSDINPRHQGHAWVMTAEDE